MKISELIAELEKVLAEAGDIQVRMDGDGACVEVGDWRLGDAPEQYGGYEYVEILSTDYGPAW